MPDWMRNVLAGFLIGFGVRDWLQVLANRTAKRGDDHGHDG